MERFSTYLSDIKVAVFYGGVNIKVHKDLLKNECPHIVVGTPGRILALTRDKDLGLKNVRHFILDECDKMLESLGLSLLFPPSNWVCFVEFANAISNLILFFILYLNLSSIWTFADMRRDVQEIFKLTPHDKQVMMFSATLSKEIRPVCKKFMQDVIFYLCDFWTVYGRAVSLSLLLFTLLLFSSQVIVLLVECQSILLF